ncbi:MAG: DUF1800 family protein [Pseudomonadota bacterium]
MLQQVETLASVRFGYGLRPGLRGPRDASDLMADLVAGDQASPLIPSPAYRHRQEAFADVGRWAAENRAGLTDQALQAFNTKVSQKYNALKRSFRTADLRALIAQRAFGFGFFERLSAFWADHFSIANPGGVAIGSVSPPTFEIEVIRPHVAGTFRDMLHAVVRSPIMLGYLDQNTSVAPKSRAGRWRRSDVNENMAREVLELHTMGSAGPYTQDDVRQFALLLSGFTIEEGRFAFRRDFAQPGYMRILERNYGGARPLARHLFAFIDDLALHPSTAAHLARKLAVHFVSPEPSEALVAHLTSAFLASDGSLPQVYQALLEHPDAWAPSLQKVKLPLEFQVALIRATRSNEDDIDEKGSHQIAHWLAQNNQPLWAPRGPDGWSEDAGHWITPVALARRFGAAAQAADRLAQAPDRDPRLFAEAVLGSSLSPITQFAVGAAETRSDGFAMIFASPEFNRR